MPNGSSNYSTWRVCNWTGLIFAIGYVTSWAIMGYNLPPFEPAISAHDLHQHYTDNNTRIKLAFTLSLFFMPMYFVWSSVVSRVMQSIEGNQGPLSVVEQMGGAPTVITGCIAGVCWLTAGFRIEERTPELVRTLHDFGWLYFDTTFMVTSLQMIAIAVVFLSDKRSTPLIPKWLSWYTILIAVIFVPLMLLPFMYTGPFAWSGLFNFWVALGGWFIWVILMFFYISKSIDRLEAE